MDGAEGRGRGKRRAGERDQCLLVRELRGVRGVLGALALLRVDGERRAVLEQRLRLRLVAVELLEPRRARLHRPREVVGGEVLPALRLLVDDALLLQEGVELRLHLKNEAIIVTEGCALPVSGCRVDTVQLAKSEPEGGSGGPTHLLHLPVRHQLLVRREDRRRRLEQLLHHDRRLRIVGDERVAMDGVLEC